MQKQVHFRSTTKCLTLNSSSSQSYLLRNCLFSRISTNHVGFRWTAVSNESCCYLCAQSFSSSLRTVYKIVPSWEDMNNFILKLIPTILTQLRWALVRPSTSWKTENLKRLTSCITLICHKPINIGGRSVKMNIKLTKSSIRGFWPAKQFIPLLSMIFISMWNQEYLLDISWVLRSIALKCESQTMHKASNYEFTWAVSITRVTTSLCNTRLGS